MEIRLANMKLQFIYMAFRLHGNIHGLFNCTCCNKHRVQITDLGSNSTMCLVCPLSPHHPSHFPLHSALRHWTRLLGWHQHPLVWRIFHSTLKKHVKGKLSFQVLRNRGQFNIDKHKKEPRKWVQFNKHQKFHLTKDWVEQYILVQEPLETTNLLIAKHIVQCGSMANWLFLYLNSDVHILNKFSGLEDIKAFYDWNQINPSHVPLSYKKNSTSCAIPIWYKNMLI